MDLYKELVFFLQEKFVFMSFEIDNWLHNKSLFRFKYKEHPQEFKQELEIKDIEMGEIDSWKIVDQREVEYFFNEFHWHMTYSRHMKSGIKSQKSKLKTHILDVVKGQAKLVLCDKRVKPFFEMQRVKVSRIKPIPEDLRKPVNELKIGDSCFIFRTNEPIKYVDPCLIYDIDTETNTKYSVMYFSNYGIDKNKAAIDGYNFAKVLPTEIGLTPEQAVKNRY